MDAREGMLVFSAPIRPEEAIADPALVPGTVLPPAAAAAPAALRWQKLDLAATPAALLPAGSAEPAALPPAVAAAAGAASVPRSDAAHAFISAQHHKLRHCKCITVSSRTGLRSLQAVFSPFQPVPFRLSPLLPGRARASGSM